MLAGEEDHLPEENEVSNVLSSDLVLDNLQSIEKSVTEEGKKLDNIDVSPEGLTDDKESYVNQICEIRESTENSLKEIQIHEEIHPNENESTKVETTLLEDSSISEKPLPSSEDNRITLPEDSSFTEKPLTASEDKETTPKEDSSITEKLLPASEDKTDIKNLDLENFECSNLGEQKSDYGQSAGVIRPSIDESIPVNTSVDSPEVGSDINQLEVLESDQIDEAKIVSGENILLQGVEQNDVIIGQEPIDSTEDKMATFAQDSESEMNLKSEENENIKCQDSSASIDKLSDESQKESSVTTELLQELSPDLLPGEQNSQDGKLSDIGESEVKTSESVEEQETDGPQAAGEEGLLYYNFGEEETKTEMMEDMKIAEIDGTLQFVPKDFVQEISETDDVQKAVTDVEEDGKMLAGEEDHLPEENEISNVLSSYPVVIASELSLCVDSLKKEMELMSSDGNHESVLLHQQVTSISNDVEELTQVLQSSNEGNDIHSALAQPEKDADIDWLKSPGILYRDVIQETLVDKEKESECRLDGDTNLPEPQVSEQVFGLAYNDFYGRSQYEQNPFSTFTLEHTQTDQPDDSSKIVSEDVCDSDYSIQPHEEIIDQSRIYVGEWLDGCHEAEPISYSEELVQDTNEVEKDDLNDTSVKEDVDSDDDYVIKLIYIPSEDESEKDNDEILEDIDNIEAVTNESAETKFQTLINQLEEIEKMPVATSRRDKIPKSLSDLAEEVVQNDFFKIGAASLENVNRIPENKGTAKEDNISREEKLEISKMDPLKQELFDKFEELFILEGDDSIDSETDEVTNNLTLHDGSSIDSYQGSVESLYVTAEEITTSEDDHFSSGRDTEGEGDVEEVDSEDEPITIQVDEPTLKISDSVHNIADETDTEVEDDIYDQNHSDNDVENDIDSCVLQEVEQEINQRQGTHDIGHDISSTEEDRHEQSEHLDSKTYTNGLSSLEVTNMDDSLEHLKPLEELLKAHEIDNIDDQAKILLQDEDQLTPSGSQNEQLTPDSSSQQLQSSPQYVCEDQQDKDDSHEQTLQLLSQYILPPDTKVDTDFEDAIVKEENETNIELKEDADITSGLALATIMEEEEDTESKVISKQKEHPEKEVASSLELHIQERTKLETEIVSLMSEILSVVSDKSTRDVERAEVQKLAEDIEDITQQMKYRHQMICMIADEIETNDESTLTSNTSTSDAESKVNISTDIEVNLKYSETDKENLHSFGKVHTKEVKHFVPFFTMDSNEGDESPNFCDDLEGIEEKDNMAEGDVIEEENNATKISNVIDQTPIEHVSLNSDDENEANIQTIEGNKGNLMFTEAQTIHPEESTSEMITKDNVISHYEGLIEPDQSLLYKLETLYFIESKDYGGDEGISPAVVAPGEEDTDLISAKESRIEYIKSKIVEKSEVSLQIEHSDALEQIPPEDEAKHLSIVSFDLPVTLTEQVEEKPSFERQISELSFEIGDSSKLSENYNSSVQTIEEQTQSKPKYTSSSQIIVDNFQVSDLTQSPPPMETSQQNIFMNMAVVEITSTDECSMSVTQSDMDDSVFGIESESESDRNRINIGEVGESDHDPEQPTFDCVPWSSRKDLYGYKSPSRIYKSEFLKEIGSPTSNDDISIQIKDTELGISEEQTPKEESDTFLSMKDDFMSEARNEKIEDYTQSNLMSDFHRDECSSPHSLTDEQILDLGESGPSPIEHPTTEEKKDETINTIFIEAQKDKLENVKPDFLLVEQILQETENISKEKFVEPEVQLVPSINLNSTDEIVQTSNVSNDAINKIQGPESNLTQDDETSMDDCKDVSKKENDMTFHDVCLDQEKLINIESTLETSKKESSIEFQDLREEQKIKNNIAFGGNAEPIINTLEEKGVNSCTGEYFVQSADIKSEQDNSKQTISDTEAEAEVEFFSNQEPAKPQVRRGETPQEIMTRILQETEEMLNTATLVETSQDNSSMNEEITCVTNAVKMLADKEEDSKVEFMQVSSNTCPEKDVITNILSNPEDVISNIETSVCHSSEDNPSINTETLLHSDQPSMREFSEYTTQSDMENVRHGEDYSSTGQNNEITENSEATQFIETFPLTISDEEDIDFESAEAWAEYSNDDNPLDYCNESDIFGRTIYDSGATNVSNVPDIVITASTPADESVHLLGAINPVNERIEECDLIPEDSVLSKQFSEFLDDESEEDFMQEENEMVAQIEDEDNSVKYNSDVYLDKLVDKLNLLEEQNIEIPFDEENLQASDKPYGILTPPDSTQSESDSESASLDAEYEMVNDTDDDLKDEVHFDEEWMTAEATESEIPIRNSSVEEGNNSDTLGQVEITESNQASSSDVATNQRNTEQSNNVSSDKATYSKPRLPSVYQRTMSATLSGVSEKPDWQVDMASIVLEGELVAEDDENVFEENTIPGEEGTSKKTDDESESKSDTSLLSLRNPFSSLCNDSTDTASECDSEKILPTDVAVSLDKKRQLQVGASSNTPEESIKKRKTRRGKKNLRAEMSISQAQPQQTTLSPDLKINKKSRSPSLEKKVETFKLGMDLEQELNETLQMLDTKKRKKKKKKSKDQSAVLTSDTACSTSETLEVKPTQVSPSVDSTAKSKKRGKGKGEKKKIDSKNQADAKPDSKSYYSLCTPELSSTASPTESETLTGVKSSDTSSSRDPTDSETRSTVRPKTKTTHIPRIEVKHDASSTTVEQQSYQGKKSSNLLDVEQTHRHKSRSKPRVHSKSRSPGRRRSNVIAVPRK